MEAVTQYMQVSIGKEEENEVVILSFDQNLPQMKQLGTSMDDIQRHVLRGNDIMYPPLRGNETHKSKIMLHNVIQQLSTNGLAYVADNLSVSANISKPKPEPQPDDVILDVCLMIQGLPPTVFTLVKDNPLSLEKARTYNLTLVQGVIKSVRRLSTEQFSAVYGLIEERDLNTLDAFKRRLETLRDEASRMYIPDSLKMHGSKCKDIVCAFLSGVALTSSVVNDDNSDTLWFLSLEQFCVLTENIDQREVIVRTAPSSGGKVLMREVARRLERSGPTALVVDSDEEIQVARNQNTCSYTFTYKEWKKRLSKGECPEDIQNMVSFCHDCSSLTGLRGKLWNFLPDADKNSASSLLKPKEQMKDDDVNMVLPSSQRLSRDQLMERNNQLKSEIESRDIRIHELVEEITSLKTAEDELRSRSELESISEGDSGYYSSMSSLAKSRTGSLSSQESLGSTGERGPQKGLFKKLRRRLSLPGTRKEKTAKPGYYTPEGPVFFLTDQQKMNPVPLICRQQEMDRARVNIAKSHVTDDGLLVNTKPSSEDLQGSLRFKEHYGTCSTLSIPLPPSLSSATFVPPASHYLETETVVALKKKLGWMTILEVGVMEESHIDGGGRSYYRGRSSCVRVGRCETHNLDLCKQVWNQGKHIRCVSSIPGISYRLRYGVVVDVVRGRVGLIDLDKGVVLGTFDDEFKENLFPVFSIYPDPEEAMVQMKIISGQSIAMTEGKQELIYSCLN